MKKLLPVAGIILFFLLSGCVRQQDFPVIPRIEFKSVSRSLVTLPAGGNSVDSVSMILSFTDGDGDIGVQDGLLDTTCASCSCLDHSTDSRLVSNSTLNVFMYTYTSGFDDSCLTGITTKFIPNNAKYNALQGDIQFNLSLECPPVGPVDTISYTFFIKDRAGHISNRVRSPGIIVRCN